MTHVMIDLETMGTRPNAPIISIGAVAFNHSAISPHSFYVNIDLSSSVNQGAVICADTLMWWLAQSDAARSALTTDTFDVTPALESFATWLARWDDLQGVWGNGATFDNVLLTETFLRAGMEKPWSHKLDRCFRTLKKLHPEVAPPAYDSSNHTAHNALCDAIWQAQYACKIGTF